VGIYFSAVARRATVSPLENISERSSLAMARKPQTRFVVEIDGQLRRVFSVREVRDGRLIVTTGGEGTKLSLNGTLVEVLTMKHTIHVSEKSETNAVTVHLTQEFVDGRRNDLFNLTHAVKNGNFQPIYSRLVGDPTRARILDRQPCDQIVSLGRYNPRAETLVLTIWLSATDVADAFPVDTHYSTVVHKFYRYGLIVAYGFAPTPSTPVGGFINFATTSKERLTETQRRLNYMAGLSEGSAPHETAKHAIFELNYVLDQMIKPTLVEPPQIKRGILLPPRFSPTPKQFTRSTTL
jgi:hypothetical protein